MASWLAPHHDSSCTGSASASVFLASRFNHRLQNQSSLLSLTRTTPGSILPLALVSSFFFPSPLILPLPTSKTRSLVTQRSCSGSSAIPSFLIGFFFVSRPIEKPRPPTTPNSPREEECPQATEPKLPEPTDLIRSMTHRGLEAAKLQRIEKIERRFNTSKKNKQEGMDQAHPLLTHLHTTVIPRSVLPPFPSCR